MYRFLLLAVVLPGLLGACAPTIAGTAITPFQGEAEGAAGEDGGSGLADIELCDAEDYRSLIGADIAATTLPADPMIRAFGEDDIVTQEYLPQRTNIVYDADGTIFRVYCG